MRSSRSCLCTLFIFSGVVLAADAHADNCSGYDVLVSQSGETLDAGGGTTLFVGRNHSIIVDADATAKDHLVIGECSGTFLSTGEGKSRGQGYCLRKHKDGDAYSVEWAMAPGADKGTWRVTGGTGKFAKSSASGWWQSSAASGKMFATRWGGNCSW